MFNFFSDLSTTAWVGGRGRPEGGGGVVIHLVFIRILPSALSQVHDINPNW